MPVIDARDAECPCRVCRGRVGEDDWDAGDRRVVGDIERFGVHIVGVRGDDKPSWAYTVGMWHSHGLAEAVMFGIPFDPMMGILNDLVSEVATDRRLAYDVAINGIIRDHPVVLRRVDPSWNEELFGYSHWFYGSYPPYVQVVWPDELGRFPWEAGVTPSVTLVQPDCSAAMPEGWRSQDDATPPPHAFWPGAHYVRCISVESIVSLGEPVLLVVHEADGDWQLLDGGLVEGCEPVVAHLHCLVDADPSLLEVKDLPRGWEAWRDDPSSPWSRRRLS